MICCLLHIIGLLCGAIGMILTWIVTIMPYWRLVVLAENNDLVIDGGRIDGEWISRWDGLWLTCLKQFRISMECDNYGSMVSLTADLKAARIFMSFAVAMSVLAFIFSIIGFILTQCCRCDDKDSERNCFTLTAGLLYFLSTVLVLIPVIWTTVNISRRAYDASFTRGAVRIEIGQALLLAWPNIIFLLGGGIMLSCLCCFCAMSTCCTREPYKQRTAACKPYAAKEERVSCSPRMEYL
ncbi:claudin-8-like [Ranitomeya variabilis]|uniref:claudin-8-like n=1 Tax=Ranitomeya variabilis TaxID=490064 RepID=UPI004057BA24